MYFLFYNLTEKFSFKMKIINYFKKIIINNFRLINLNSSGIKLNIKNQYYQINCHCLFASRLNFDKGISEYIDVSNKLKKEFPFVFLYSMVLLIKLLFINPKRNVN